MTTQARDLSAKFPRGKGGYNSNLIVVGNARYDNSRFPTSQYLDAGHLGILTLYNVGDDVDCAIVSFDNHGNPRNSDVTWGVEPSGTSQATAITAGMIAYYMSQPALSEQFRASSVDAVPFAVKRFLQNTANKFKLSASISDGIPRAALGEVLPCRGGTRGTPAVQTPFVPNPGFLRRLTTTQVTDGEIVVINPLVSQ
jgi:hypothetical protein